MAEPRPVQEASGIHLGISGHSSEYLMNRQAGSQLIPLFFSYDVAQCRGISGHSPVTMMDQQLGFADKCRLTNFRQTSVV